MSINAASNSSEGKKVNRRYARENPTILTSVIREEDVESDDDYENEETSDSEDDDDVIEKMKMPEWSGLMKDLHSLACSNVNS